MRSHSPLPGHVPSDSRPFTRPYLVPTVPWARDQTCNIGPFGDLADPNYSSLSKAKSLTGKCKNSRGVASVAGAEQNSPEPSAP